VCGGGGVEVVINCNANFPLLDKLPSGLSHCPSQQDAEHFGKSSFFRYSDKNPAIHKLALTHSPHQTNDDTSRGSLDFYQST
jgi:hypothetical protein